MRPISPSSSPAADEDEIGVARRQVARVAEPEPRAVPAAGRDRPE